MAIHRLEIEYDYDFELFGIRSSEEFYRLAYLLNAHLQIGLEKSREQAMIEEVDGRLALDYYFWNDPIYESEWRMIGNRVLPPKEKKSATIDLFTDIEDAAQLQSFVAKEFKEIDYFVQVYGIISTDLKRRLLGCGKHIKTLQTVLEIDVPKMREKENFLLIDYAN